MRWLTAIPVYNEVSTVRAVLQEVRRHSPEILVVNDGSTDGTAEVLATEAGVHVVNHPRNRGYGGAIATMFDFAVEHNYDVLVTTDCDGQHEPSRIPVLLEALTADVDIVSGSRYLRDFRQNDPAPNDRRWINRTITEEINERYHLNLTDAFCGFKAYRRRAIESFRITEFGWGMPLQLWVQAVRVGLKVAEVAVPRLYLDPNRAFGGLLNDADERIAYYRRVLADAEKVELPNGVASLVTESCA